MRKNDPAFGRLFRLKGRRPTKIIRVRERHGGQEEWLSGETFTDETVRNPDGQILSHGPRLIQAAARADLLRPLSDDEARKVEEDWAARIGEASRRRPVG